MSEKWVEFDPLTDDDRGNSGKTRERRTYIYEDGIHKNTESVWEYLKDTEPKRDGIYRDKDGDYWLHAEGLWSYISHLKDDEDIELQGQLWIIMEQYAPFIRIPVVESN